MKRAKRSSISIHDLHCFVDSINHEDGTAGKLKIHPLPANTYQVVDRKTGSPMAGADDLSLSDLYVWLNGYRQRQMDEVPQPLTIHPDDKAWLDNHMKRRETLS